MSPVPHCMERHLYSIGSSKYQFLRNHSVGAAGSCKSCSLGKGTKLYSAFLRAFDLINAVRKPRLRNKGLICRIKQDYRLIGSGIIDPALQLFLIITCTCGIIGRAQVNQISLNGRIRHRQEVIFRRSIYIYDLPAVHDIGIHIHRIHRIRHQYHIILCEKICDISGITLCPVRDKDRIRIHICAISLIICGDSISKEFISFFRTISFKRL